MTDYSAEYSVHRTLSPGVADRVELTLGVENREQRYSKGGVAAVVTHRGGEGELFFDFTYPDHSAPTGISVSGDNSFVVLPGHSFRVNSDTQQPLDFILISAAAVPYSVQVYL